MAIAYHVLFSAYGFWLPNDPRGSWSDYVWSERLKRFGPATKVSTRRSVANAPHDRALRLAAKQALKYPPVRFSGLQARAAVRGFAQATQEGAYVVHACSILPEHVHLVLARHPRSVPRIIGHMKARATQRLKFEGLWPDEARPVWAIGGWKVFLDTPDDVRRAIAYVENNPLKERKRRQNWKFVVPFDGLV